MAIEKINKIKVFFKKLGLSEKEISAYLYLLKNGPQHVTQLSKSCGFTRTNGYDISKKLEEKGLCFNLGSLYGRKIKANTPKEIKTLIENKTKEIAGLQDELTHIIPLFSDIEITTRSAKTEVSYFSGKESLRKLLVSVLQTENKEIIIAGSELDLIDTLGSEFMVDWNEKRKNKGIFLRALRPGDKRGAHIVFKNDEKYLRAVQIRPENKIRLKSILVVFDSKTAFISTKDDLFGTLIDNQGMSTMLTSWFNFIWDSIGSKQNN